MATNWTPVTQLEQRAWLLANGDVVTEPLLEESPSGLKVRIKGEPDMSAYRKDTDALLIQAIKATAANRNTELWMPLTKRTEALTSSAEFTPETTKAKLHILGKERAAKTIVWWRFQHPTMPITALLTVRAGLVNTYHNTNQKVETFLTLPNMVQGDGMYAAAEVERNPNFYNTESNVGGSEWDDFVRANPAAWADVLGTEVYTNERSMVEALLKAVRACDDLDTIQVPDLRNPLKPAWLDLELKDSNLNASLVNDLQEYLEGTPDVDNALRLYGELRDTLRRMGVVLDETTNNGFQQALLNGEQSGLTVGVNKDTGLAGEGVTHDGDHSLTMHLPTGTFVVSCALHKSIRADVTDAWDEAITIASLTGEEDALLAYAREFARSRNEARAQAILKERQKAQKK